VLLSRRRSRKQVLPSKADLWLPICYLEYMSRQRINFNPLENMVPATRFELVTP
jgi:hypothetical protein